MKTGTVGMFVMGILVIKMRSDENRRAMMVANGKRDLLTARPRRGHASEKHQKRASNDKSNVSFASFITLPYGDRFFKRALFPLKRLRIGSCD